MGSTATNINFINCLPWKICGPVILSLPLGGLAFGVVYSILYNFQEANRTHCGVWNFFPSISAAVGSLEPQMSVWWWCIVVHTPARYFICLVYATLYSTVSSLRWRQFYSPVVAFVLICHMVEISALLLLTLVTSSSDFGLHKTSFLTFILMSVVYMISTILLQHSLVKDTKNRVMRSSLRFKMIYCAANILSLLAAGYMYYRHNTYCEPGVYSLFALSEYTVVLTNIAYHSTAVKDFTSVQLLGVPTLPFSDV